LVALISASLFLAETGIFYRSVPTSKHFKREMFRKFNIANVQKAQNKFKVSLAVNLSFLLRPVYFNNIVHKLSQRQIQNALGDGAI